MFNSKRSRAMALGFSLFGGVLLFTSGFFLGTSTTGAYGFTLPATTLTKTTVTSPSEVDLSLFWQAWKVLDQKYVNGTTTAASSTDQVKERVYGAISGMVDSLGDPYTVFLPPDDNEAFKEDIRGDFGGVGMELGIRDGELTVVSAIENTPAKKAGIVSGDKITRIEGIDVKKYSIDQAVKRIRGDIGTQVKLTVYRPSTEKTYDFTLTRARIQVPTLDTQLLGSGVFVIKLHNFNANAPELFRDGLKKFINSKSDKLILDLRGNPGGYLDAAVSISSWFLPEGKVVVRESFGGKAEDKIHRSRGYNVFNDKLKMVVLVDKGSASASEIVAGALAEHGRAILIGETTFGKGSVQELVNLSGGSALKVTIAKWLTPNGHSLAEGGLEPKIKVELSDKDRADGRDPQLDAAVKYLLGR